MSDARAEPLARRRPLVRVTARPGAAPLGAILGGIGLLGGLAVSLLGLDRLPFVVCLFKSLSGLPCPTCGSTRAVARLFARDPAGALAMNPLTTLGALAVAAWALADLALLPRGRALSVELEPRLGSLVRAAVIVAFLLNWAYLLAAGR